MNWGYNTETGIPSIVSDPSLADVSTSWDPQLFEGPPEVQTWVAAQVGMGVPRGLGAAWAILAAWPDIVFMGDKIYDRGISTASGSRYIQIHADADGWHMNADIGLVRKLGHRVDLPTVGPYIKPVAKAAPFVGLAVDVADVGFSAYADYQAADQWNFGPNTQQATGRVAGGWAGAFAGAAVGTFWLPGLGTAAGALIGGIVGGIGGSFGGERLVGWIRRR